MHASWRASCAEKPHLGAKFAHCMHPKFTTKSREAVPPLGQQEIVTNDSAFADLFTDLAPTLPFGGAWRKWRSTSTPCSVQTEHAMSPVAPKRAILGPICCQQKTCGAGLNKYPPRARFLCALHIRHTIYYQKIRGHI